MFLLQFAAGCALALTNYGYTLDVQTARGLFKMKVTCVATFVVLIYSRAVRYSINGYAFLQIIHADGRMHLLYAAWAAFVLMACFNLLFIMDATGKLVSTRYKSTNEAHPSLRSIKSIY